MNIVQILGNFEKSQIINGARKQILEANTFKNTFLDK